MDVLVNQVGYETGGPKRAVVRAAEDGADEIDGFRVVDTADDSVAFEGSAVFEGHVHDWRDWVFWTLEFDSLSATGEYRVAIVSDQDDRELQSESFEIADNVVQEEVISDVLFYFKTQRCSGRYNRADRSIPFVGDHEDDVDVRGGWYDASGDTSKYLSHLSYANYMNPQQTPVVAWGLLDAYERLRTYDHAMGEHLAERLLEEALHGADFLLRMLDGEGYFYATVFDGWSKDVERREICAYESQAGNKTDDYEAGYRQGGGVAIAALARASRATAPESIEYLRHLPSDHDPDAYRSGAIEAFDHLERHNEAYLDDGTENVIDDYCALLAATELFDATGTDRFREAATDRARSLLDRLASDDRYDGWWRADDGDRPFFHAAEEGFPVIALVRYLDAVPDSSLDADVRSAIERYWRFELGITDEVVNPFGYARQYVRAVDEDEARTAFFMPHENETSYWWQGENARIASLAAAAYRSTDVLEDDALAASLEAFARDQINWIMGLNPFEICMIHGVGRNGPTYHERFREVPGGVTNGITAGFEDESDIAFCPEPWGQDHGHRWRWLEQWLPHAAWFFVAATSSERV